MKLELQGKCEVSSLFFFSFEYLRKCQFFSNQILVSILVHLSSFCDGLAEAVRMY